MACMLHACLKKLAERGRKKDNDGSIHVLLFQLKRRFSRNHRDNTIFTSVTEFIYYRLIFLLTFLDLLGT